MSKVKYGYMDKVDFDHELEGAKGGNRIFSSVKDLKANKSCWDECGIIKVKVEHVSTEVPQNFEKYDE